jgi:DNA-binding MarR family transcriptional regulator
MAHRSVTELLVLHALGLKGFADATAIALMTGLDRPVVDTQLDAAQRAGLVDRRGDPVSGWALTPLGRTRHRALLAADVDASGALEVVIELYGRFMAINTRLRQVAAEWHLRAGDGRCVPNLHEDGEYDRSVVTALREIDERVQPICASLAGVEERMSRYGRRLSAALARVDAGERDAVARPLAGSYDEVWTELQEDLQLTSTAATPVAP